MMTADGYGNAGAYFNNTNNYATAFYLSIYNASPGKRPTSAYSVIRMEGSGGIDLINRMDVAPGAIVGRQGMRAVAFPLHVGWNWDTETN